MYGRRGGMRSPHRGVEHPPDRKGCRWVYDYIYTYICGAFWVPFIIIAVKTEEPLGSGGGGGI